MTATPDPLSLTLAQQALRWSEIVDQRAREPALAAFKACFGLEPAEGLPNHWEARCSVFLVMARRHIKAVIESDQGTTPSAGGRPPTGRVLSWGFEYLTYFSDLCNEFKRRM